MASNGGDDVPTPKSVTYVDYENPFSFVSQSSGAPHVATLSRNAWVGCGGDIYVLECLGKGHIRIEPVQEDEGSSAILSPLLDTYKKRSSSLPSILYSSYDR
jgi:ATP-dependent helicase IRC3